MRAPAALLVLVAHVGGATLAAAQCCDEEAPPDPIPPRVEIGGVAGLTVAYPEIGVLASVPTGPGASFEVAVGWLPRVIYDVEHTVAQAQFRLPFRPRLRSRRSLLLGVTRIAARRRGRYDGGFWGSDGTVVFAHAGASLQWPMGPHADFRFDAQALFTFESEFPMVPRAVTTFVWHPDRRAAPRSARGQR